MVKRLPIRLFSAIIVGLITSASFQLTNWWFLAPLGVAGFCWVVRGRSLRQAGLLGLAFAWPMWWAAISWLSVLDPGAPVALAFIQSLWFILLGMALTAIQPGNPTGTTGRSGWRNWGSDDERGLVGWPLWAAAAWMATEYAFSRWPWGGFGWVRLGYPTVDSPWAGILPFLGVPGAGFLVAILGCTIVWLILDRPRRMIGLGAVAVLVGITITTGVLRNWLPAQQVSGSVNVGIVQGNVFGVGINAMGRARSMPNNHLDETIRLLADAQSGGMAKPDLIVWPESSADSDPRRDQRTRDTLATAAKLSGVPILAGVVLTEPRHTSVLWWDPTAGITDRYDKQNLVPFGEFVPMREILEPALFPVLPVLELVGPQGVPGTGPGLLKGKLNDGRHLRVGDLICYELAYDATVATMFTQDPQVIIVQSNNAPYGYSAQNAQQFAITRARAMEGRREIAVVTTSGTSGLIDQRGHVVDQIGEFTNAHRVYSMPVRSGRTPATWLAIPASQVISVLGVLGAVVALTRLIRTRRRASTVDEH